MEYNKSLDVVKLIAALLHDVQTSHGAVFDTRACRLTCLQVEKRVRSEGIGFLTKTLPRLGKAFDKALSQNESMNATALGFSTNRGSKLPRFLGELFIKVLNPDGTVLQDPCATTVRIIRQILGLFYKYELPYEAELEQKVIDRFIQTEQELSEHEETIQEDIERYPLDSNEDYETRISRYYAVPTRRSIIREAREHLKRVFFDFSCEDIVPSHGPGAVATRQQLWDKYDWTNISDKITKVYPLDAYFYASLTHFCDEYKSVARLSSQELPARVILVPKDSRGPRLISCEPVDFQWIQQGLSRAIVQHVESIPLTKWNVFFTDQQPNQFGALYGSESGKYATLDLNEASDRVSLALVRLLFPKKVLPYLEACRTSATTLPNGDVLELRKFAPMGSALCFPILALTVWSILTAAAPNRDTRDSIYVYGDDVIVPTAFAANAMEHLESFGLKINRDKSCISGFFRESCGCDAFKGVNVTPVRLRTVWSSSPSPSSYSSWISYANSFWDRKYFKTYDYIVGLLTSVYKSIPGDDMHLACPSLREVSDSLRPKRRRTNIKLQKLEYKVYDVKTPVIKKDIPGWSMLLRYFTEAQKPHGPYPTNCKEGDLSPFSASSYTRRRASILVRRWR